MANISQELRKRGLRGFTEHLVDAHLTERSVSDRDRPGLPHLILFALGYLLAIWLGYRLSLAPASGVTLWPPSGIFLATLLLTPTRHWPWWVLAGLPAEAVGDMWLFGFHLPVSLSIYAGNTTEAVVGAWLVRRWRGTPFHFETLQDVLALTLLAAGVGPMISATVGSATLALSGGNAFTVSWPLWWIGDASGVLIFAPLLLVIVERWRDLVKLPPARWAEAWAVGAAFLGAVHIALTGPLFVSYLVVPPLLWAAIRFEIPGAVAASLVLALMTTGYASAGLGKFASMSSPEAMQLLAQCFIGVLTLSALIIAALSAQHRRALRSLQSARDELERRVLERTAELRESKQWLLQAQRAANAGVWQVDLSSGAFKASDEALRLHGIAPGTAMTHQMALNVVHPDDRSRVQEALRRAWEEDVPFRVELRSPQPDGSVRWLLSQAEIGHGSNGRRLVGLVQDITERKQSEEQFHLVMREINHRSKNLLTLVQVVARRTAGDDARDFRKRLERRIQALAAHQDLLFRNEWKGVELEELVRAQLSHFQDLVDQRITVCGSSLMVTAPASQTLGMALHELATNASKYGALSSPHGRVEINWSLAPDDTGIRRFIMTWAERDGPPVIKPAHRGFGSTLIDQIARAELDAEISLDFEPSGLRWRLECAADKLVQSVG